jgi:hypothetical protein
MRRQVRHQVASSQTSPEEQREVARINARFLTGKTEEERRELEHAWLVSKPLRKALVEVLTEDIQRSIIKEEGELFLQKPEPLVAIADQRGYRRALRMAIKLLQQDPDNE